MQQENILKEQSNCLDHRTLQGHQINPEDLRKILPPGEISYQSIVDAFDIPYLEYFNMAHATVDKHSAGKKSGKTALICVSQGGESQSYTYRDLSESSSRFAEHLRKQGVKKTRQRAANIICRVTLFTLRLHCAKMESRSELFYADLGGRKNANRIANGG